MAKTTKIIKIGQDESAKKKIVFHSFLQTCDSLDSWGGCTPNKFGFIELICENYRGYGEDLMLCYDDKRIGSECYLILGHFNDGVV